MAREREMSRRFAMCSQGWLRRNKLTSDPRSSAAELQPQMNADRRGSAPLFIRNLIIQIFSLLKGEKRIAILVRERINCEIKGKAAEIPARHR